MWNGKAKEQRRGNQFWIVLVFWFLLSVCPPSLRAAVPGTLSLHVFNGCLPNQAFTAGNFSTPHSVRREELHSWLGWAPCQAASRLPGRKGGEGEGERGAGSGVVVWVPCQHYSSAVFSSLTIVSVTKPLRKRKKRQNSRSKQTLFSALQCKVAFIRAAALQVLRFYSVFSCVNVSKVVFSSFCSFRPSSFHSPFLFLIVCFVRFPALYVRPFFSPFSIPSCSPLSFLFCCPPQFHSKNSAVVEQWLNRNNICCTLPPSWSYSLLTTRLIFSRMQGLVISCGWCRLTFAVWDLNWGVKCDLWLVVHLS